MIRNGIAFDAATKRQKDANGFLHVESSHLTKEQVAPYYGFEIPNYEKFKLQPNKIYYGFRSGEELQKAVNTFNGLPLMLHHHVVSAEDTKKEYRVGSLGTNATWNAPYIDNALTITDKSGIDAVESGKCREISLAYQYDPDFTAGQFEGVSYDFVMRNIKGNHAALVEEGRAGRDVVVADSQIINPLQKGKEMLKNFFKGAFDSDPDVEKKEVDLAQAIIDLHKVDPKTGELSDVQEDEDKAAKVKEMIGKLTADADPEDIKVLADALNDLSFSKEEKIEEEAKDDDLELIKRDDVEEEEEAEDDDLDDVADLDVEEEEVEEDDDIDPMEKKAIDAMKACGLDADEDVKEAFKKGFAYGMKDGEEDKPAVDSDMKEKAEKKMAQDAALIKRRIVASVEGRYKAASEIAPAVGQVNPMAFDSAQSIYAHALNEMGYPTGSYKASSARDMFKAIMKTRQAQFAQDAAPKTQTFTGVFAGLNSIK